MSYKFLHLSTFEEIEHNYLTRFSKQNLRQPPAFVNYDNTQYFLGDRNYGIQFYQRLKIKGKLDSNDNEADCFQIEKVNKKQLIYFAFKGTW